MPLPELAPAPAGAAQWRVDEAAGAVPWPAESGTPAGAESLYAGVHARLCRRDADWRIDVEDTGFFDYAAAARAITFRRHAGGTDDFFRAHLLGRVLATALHDEGHLVLHASAVLLGQGAVAFCAPKHSGKTTLSLALVEAGGRLLTDDTLPVEAGASGVVAWPGVHSARLLPDALDRLGGGRVLGEREDGKLVVAGLDPARLATAPVPLAAVYLLMPASWVENGAAAARQRLSTPAAAAGLVGQAKVVRMLGVAEEPAILRRAATVAREIPVYRLALLHDFARLAEAVATLLAWHGGPAGAAA